MIRVSKLDFVCILLMGVAILCLFGDGASHLLNHKFVYYLGKLSYPIYLHQMSVLILIGGRSTGAVPEQLWFLGRYLILLLVLSMLSLWLCEWCTAAVKRKWCPQQ